MILNLGVKEIRFERIPYKVPANICFSIAQKPDLKITFANLFYNITAANMVAIPEINWEFLVERFPSKVTVKIPNKLTLTFTQNNVLTFTEPFDWDIVCQTIHLEIDNIFVDDRAIKPYVLLTLCGLLVLGDDYAYPFWDKYNDSY